MRSRAKAVNFGIVYGISPFSLSQDIGVTVAEAKGVYGALLRHTRRPPVYDGGGGAGPARGATSSPSSGGVGRCRS